MSTSNEALTDDTVRELRELLAKEDAVDWRTISLVGPDVLRAGRAAIAGAAQDAPLLAALKGYQRLLRVLPTGAEAYALPLLVAGLHSALQIAELTPHEFALRWANLFPGEAELGERVHRNAVTRRVHVSLHHVQKTELSQPHYSAARFR
jgi:hypothetical protein